jgi:hypothetical protein
MNVDKRIIEPFNAWWRPNNHCLPPLDVIKGFDAGWKAALEEVRKATQANTEVAHGEK